jgi:hypothetical protein
MLSVLGCFVRATWYFIFAVVVLAGETVETPSILCQFSGFCINLGNGIAGKHCCTLSYLSKYANFYKKTSQRSSSLYMERYMSLGQLLPRLTLTTASMPTGYMPTQRSLSSLSPYRRWLSLTQQGVILFKLPFALCQYLQYGPN